MTTSPFKIKSGWFAHLASIKPPLHPGPIGHDHVPVSVAARDYGISPSTIYSYIDRGFINGYKDGNGGGMVLRGEISTLLDRVSRMALDERNRRRR